MSRNKIYNDISKSDYRLNASCFEFYFSSMFYLEKFRKMYLKFIDEETIKLKIKYKCEVTFDDLLLLTLYRKIEKRGFNVIYKGKVLDENYLIGVIIS